MRRLIAGASRPSRPRTTGSCLALLIGPDDSGDDPALLTQIRTSLVDLVALALGADPDGADIARTRGLRSARLQQVLAHIRANFGDPTVSAASVAAKLGVTPRYVQDLLHATGRTFAERVLELRLQQARAMLGQRDNEHLRVGDIALACGFNEVSYFNRCFRRRFGATPTQYRGGG